MNQKPLIVIVLPLLLSMAAPPDASGGFGLLQRLRAKLKCRTSNVCRPVCVQATPVRTAPVQALPSEAAPMEPKTQSVSPPRVPLTPSMYRVSATVVGMSPYGGTCAASSDDHFHTDCEIAKANAIQQARDRFAVQCSGHSEVAVKAYCEPSSGSCCESTMTYQAVPGDPLAEKQVPCQYEVTYKLYCCNRCVVPYTAVHPNRHVAKHLAKAGAYFYARPICDGRYRKGCWTTRCVPTP